MVVKSGDESIVKMDREIIRKYIAIAWACIFCVGAAVWLGGVESAEYHTHGPMAYYVLFCGLPLAFLGVKLLQLARVFSQLYVVIGPEGVKLRLLAEEGTLLWFIRPTLAVPPERYFGWDEIGGIKKDSDGSCWFHAGNQLYVLRPERAPTPLAVVQLLAERLGTPLRLTPDDVEQLSAAGVSAKLPPSSEEKIGQVLENAGIPASVIENWRELKRAEAALKPPPPRKKPMSRPKLAARLGKISFVSIGLTVVGAWWLHRHQESLYFGPVLAATVVPFVIGGTLFFTAILLLLLELNHRL